MLVNPFESQLEKLARTLTEQFGVAVVCQGDSAYTDGRTIVLPTLPEPLPHDLERMMVGYLDHEMAHVAFTDFTQVERFNRRHRGFEAMLNVVEDALIEKRAMQRWPGVRANLDALFTAVRDRVAAGLPQAAPFRRFCTAIYLKLSHHTDLLGLDRELKGYGDLLDRFPQVADTRDAAQLSKQLLKRWLSRQPRPKSPADCSQAKSQSPPTLPTSGANPPPPPASAEPDQPALDSGEVKPKAASAKDASADDPSAPSTGSAATGLDEKSLDKEQVAALTQGTRGSMIAEAVQDSMARAVAGIDPTRQYRPFTRGNDRIEVLPAAGETEVRQLLADNVDTVRRLRRGLTNALRAAEKRWWREEQTRGQLSPRTLFRLGLDQAGLEIFRTRACVQGRSTAVSILLDASGSMSAGKMMIAREALRVLLDALAELRIPTEAFTFTTGSALDVDRAARESGLSAAEIYLRFARITNLEIGLIQRFGEPVKAALQRLPNVRGTGLTPIGEALEIGAARLMPRRENRRILLIVTDGQAGCECGAGVAVRHAQDTAARITRAGIELIGVAIRDPALCAIVNDTIVVQTITDLPAQLCRLLSQTLQKGLHHVG